MKCEYKMAQRLLEIDRTAFYAYTTFTIHVVNTIKHKMSITIRRLNCYKDLVLYKQIRVLVVNILSLTFVEKQAQ